MEQALELLLNSAHGGYVLALCLLCRVFITVAPIKLTEKMPDWLMMLISACALASNKRTDNKGNPL
ncbi:hypothetical protein VA249_29890 [Vibrio alfacsensis]|uniref:hypothetical protein n=1 Tax=Vibrio alfacsensis TaxID=1074311 RepID=UPI001BF0E85A|nr:hypothetical protein [Vibrio alfacsensis]BBM66343.1 hypothetical protein VA249_29890 [Vibrio alfacsensis]